MSKSTYHALNPGRVPITTIPACSPFHEPLNPMFPHVLELALPAVSPPDPISALEDRPEPNHH
jgi:hypothetical protein